MALTVTVAPAMPSSSSSLGIAVISLDLSVDGQLPEHQPVVGRERADQVDGLPVPRARAKLPPRQLRRVAIRLFRRNGRSGTLVGCVEIWTIFGTPAMTAIPRDRRHRQRCPREGIPKV